MQYEIPNGCTELGEEKIKLTELLLLQCRHTHTMNIVSMGGLENCLPAVIDDCRL